MKYFASLRHHPSVCLFFCVVTALSPRNKLTSSRAMAEETVEKIARVESNEEKPYTAVEVYYGQYDDYEVLDLFHDDKSSSDHYHGADILQEMNLCTLQPDAIIDGYEFADHGLVISPLQYDHILYTESGYPDSCWCVGACLRKSTAGDGRTCDFKGGLKLELHDYADRLSLQVLNTFSTLIITVYTIHGEVIEKLVERGSLYPVIVVVHARGMMKVEINAEYGGAWCLHKLIRFSHPKKEVYTEPPTPQLPYQVHTAIKPRLCPNNFWNTGNPNSQKKILPVAILGTSDFDVKSMDFGSVTLEGYSGEYQIYPVGFHYIDVTAPNHKKSNKCDCTHLPPDGFLDVILHFNKADVTKIPEVAAAYGGEEVVLRIQGAVTDSQHFAHKIEDVNSRKDFDGKEGKDADTRRPNNELIANSTVGDKVVLNETTTGDARHLGHNLSTQKNSSMLIPSTPYYGSDGSANDDLFDLDKVDAYSNENIGLSIKKDPASYGHYDTYFYGEDCIVIIKGGGYD